MHFCMLIFIVYFCRFSGVNSKESRKLLAINSPDNVACRANEMDFLKYYPLHNVKLHQKITL